MSVCVTGALLKLNANSVIQVRDNKRIFMNEMVYNVFIYTSKGSLYSLLNVFELRVFTSTFALRGEPNTR